MSKLNDTLERQGSYEYEVQPPACCNPLLPTIPQGSPDSRDCLYQYEGGVSQYQSGTVYRNLNQLAEAGMIAKHSFGVLSIDHFDYNTSPHYHFVCKCCNAVIDLPMEHSGFASIDEAASEGFDGLIEEHRLYFCGICKNCLDKASGQT